jgi:hypothetical protein
VIIPGFDRVVAVDTEFTPVVGGNPIPLCLVAHELISDSWARLVWPGLTGQDAPWPGPPFATDDKTLYVTFVASAESQFFLTCGWPQPARVLDLFVEYRNYTNKAVPKSHPEHPKAGLVDACHEFGIIHPTQNKKQLQNLALRGGPYTEQEQWDLLQYCEDDVVVLAPLLAELLTHIRSRRKGPGAPLRGLSQALYRGRYTNSVAGMQYTGLPVDVPTLSCVQTHRREVVEHVIRKGDRDYGVFRGTALNDGLFRRFVTERGWLDTWPRTDARGYLRTDQDTMKDQARAHPELDNLREMLLLRGALRDFPLAVGPDGRNRTELWAFGTATGRNAPSSTKSLMGASCCWRALMKPTEGKALAYVDYSAQEIAIAAALSGCPQLLKAVESGDPYLMLGYRAGITPDGATKQTHKRERDICKVAMLGMNYRMQVPSLAAGTGLSLIQAQNLYRQLQLIFERFWEWSEEIIDTGLLRQELWTYCGWRVRVVEDSKLTSLKNFPAQAHGAEILRLACCLIYERGIRLCWPVHDAVIIEADVDKIDEAVAVTQQCMAQASRVVLNGFEIRTDAEIVRYPDRYMDSAEKRCGTS